MSDNSKLMAMLAGAKNVMNKVESGDYEVGNVDVTKQSQTSDNLVESTQGAPGSEYAPRPANTKPMGTSYKNLSTSKMDPAILKAMVENPMPQQTMASGNGPTFTLEDVQALVQKEVAQAPQNVHAPVQQVQEQAPVANQYGQKVITMTEAELEAKIKNTLFEFMATTFVKTLKEETIKKTIGTLIKEGKIKVSKKRA
jgi:hypothetical protein